MFITRKKLSRRHFLRGTGVAVSLPVLDAMVPALAQSSSPASSRMRFGAVYLPNGALPEIWHPTETGKHFNFTAPMSSLEPFRDQLITVSGLLAGGTPGAHLGGLCSFLNGYGARNAQGESILSEKSLDQYFVDQYGLDTPLPSIEVGTEDMGTSIGNCDGYSCLYFNSIAWRTATQPLPVEVNPRRTFERMFGETGSADQRNQRMRVKNSLLDAISDDVSELHRTLGSSDIQVLDNYLENVREVERRLQRIMARSDESNFEAPTAPTGIPGSFEEHMALTYDLMHLAYQGDISRVFTFMTGLEASNRSYPFAGAPESHHTLSHHGDDPLAKEKYMKIVTWHVEQLARFVQKLKDTPDGDGNLLDHSMLYFASAMGNGNPHDQHDHPALIIGGADGRLAGSSGHLKLDFETPTSNLLVGMAQAAGLDVETIGPSTGAVTI